MSRKARAGMILTLAIIAYTVGQMMLAVGVMTHTHPIPGSLLWGVRLSTAGILLLWLGAVVNGKANEASK